MPSLLTLKMKSCLGFSLKNMDLFSLGPCHFSVLIGNAVHHLLLDAHWKSAILSATTDAALHF